MLGNFAHRLKTNPDHLKQSAQGRAFVINLSPASVVHSV